MSRTQALPPTSAPPQPSYILRGHTDQIHSLAFLSTNTRLLTGDAAGNCILWSLPTRRPLAVWRAHDGPLLSVAPWYPRGHRTSPSPHRRIITHGRDHALYVWKLGLDEEDALDASLPADPPPLHPNRKPWLVASLGVNTLNFCGFAMHEEEEEDEEDSPGVSSPVSYNPVLIAVPSTLDSKSVDIFSLPAGTRLHTRIASTAETGMAMALALTRVNGMLTLVAGYESGHVIVFRHNTIAGSWERRYEVKCHTQPVLSLSISPGRAWFLTTSADSLVIRHALSDGGRTMRTVDSKHSGLQSVRVRSDAKVFATAGWDGRFRVFSARSLKELAVLKWHNVGCYAVEFAEILPEGEDGEEVGGEAVSTKMGVEGARVRRESGRHWVAGGAKDGKVSLWEIY